MKCEDVKPLLTQYLLGDLDDAGAAEVREHVESCGGCRAYMQKIEPTLDLLRDALAAPSSAPKRLSIDRHVEITAKATSRSGKILRWFTVEHCTLSQVAAAMVVGFILLSMLLPSLSSSRRQARKYAMLGDSAKFGMDVNISEIQAPAAAAPSAVLEDFPTDGNRQSQVYSVGGSVRAVSKREAAKSDELRTVDMPVAAREELRAAEDKSSRGWADAGSADRASSLALPPIAVEPLYDRAQAGNAVKIEDSARRLGAGRRDSQAMADPFVGVPGAVSTASSDPFAAPAGQVAAAAAPQPAPQEKSFDLVEIIKKPKPLFIGTPTNMKNVNLDPNRKDRAGGNYDERTVAAGNEAAARSNVQQDEKRKQTTFGQFKDMVDSAPVIDSEITTTPVVPSPVGMTKSPVIMKGLYGSTAKAKERESAVKADADDDIKIEVSPVEKKEEDKSGPRFKAFGVNPFVSAAEKAFSTFAISCDSASYTLARNYMNRGYLPPAEAVRTEEFVNFFDYAYKAPERDTFKVYVECAPSKFGRGGLQMMKIGVKGRRLGREEQRRAVLTFLVDTSGSMELPDRIGLAKKSLRMLVEKLNPQDLVSIVKYDSHARIVLEHVPAAEKQRILDAIDSLQCSGSTNLEEGMERAYQIAARNFISKGENRVLLLSDGVANLGNMAAKDILGKVEKYRKQGIFCSVFGLGMGTYDDTMLQELASKGDGVYKFLDSEAEAKSVFVDDLSANLNTIAKDVKIQVEFNPKRINRYRQVGYESRQLKTEDFRNDKIDAGEVGSGQSVTALYEAEVRSQKSEVGSRRADNKDDVIATVRVRYQRVDNGQIEEIERQVTSADMIQAFDQADVRFRLAVCAAQFAEILRGSPFAEGREFQDVARVLAPVALELNLDGRVQEFNKLVTGANGLSRGQ